MSIFCHHDWSPRAGMSSGSICVKCFNVTEKECNGSAGLSSGYLENKSILIKDKEDKQ